MSDTFDHALDAIESMFDGGPDGEACSETKGWTCDKCKRWHPDSHAECLYCYPYPTISTDKRPIELETACENALWQHNWTKNRRSTVKTNIPETAVRRVEASREVKAARIALRSALGKLESAITKMAEADLLYNMEKVIKSDKRMA